MAASLKQVLAWVRLLSHRPEMLLARKVVGWSRYKSATHTGNLVVAGAFDNERCWDSVFLRLVIFRFSALEPDLEIMGGGPKGLGIC